MFCKVKISKQNIKTLWGKKKKKKKVGGSHCTALFWFTYVLNTASSSGPCTPVTALLAVIASRGMKVIEHLPYKYTQSMQGLFCLVKNQLRDTL